VIDRESDRVRDDREVRERCAEIGEEQRPERGRAEGIADVAKVLTGASRTPNQISGSSTASVPMPRIA